MRNLCIAALVAGGLTASMLGDVIGNPYDGIETTGSLAQDFVFPGTDPLDTWVVSDFQTAVDYHLFEVWSEGWTTDLNNNDGEGATYDIWNGLPWEDGSIVMSAGDGYCALGSANTMGADFGGQFLPAGDYYMVFQAVYDFVLTGGLTLVCHTYTGNEDDWQWDPGLGQDWGAEFRAIMTDEPAPNGRKLAAHGESGPHARLPAAPCPRRSRCSTPAIVGRGHAVRGNRSGLHSPRAAPHGPCPARPFREVHQPGGNSRRSNIR